MARLLRTTGVVSFVQPQDSAAFSLTELHAYVGGSPQIVPYSSYSADALVTHVLIARGLGADEPAQPFNSAASMLAGQSVYGDVLMLDVDALRSVRSQLSPNEWNALRGMRLSQDNRALGNLAMTGTSDEKRPSG